MALFSIKGVFIFRTLFTVDFSRNGENVTASSERKKPLSINILVSFRSLLLSEALCKAIGEEVSGSEALASPDPDAPR